MEDIILKKYYTEPEYNYNVISVCVFRMINNYKPTTVYYNGLKELIKNFNDFFPAFYLRIYHDSSILKTNTGIQIVDKENKELWKPLIKKAREDKKIQLIKYTHPAFLIKGTPFHEGVFGTIVRFMPLFDYKENNGINDVYISDIDIPRIIFEYTRTAYKKMLETNIKVYYSTKYCYGTQPRFMIKSKDNENVNMIPYNIMAGIFISRVKFPHKMLDDFINCMKNLDVKDCNYIKKFTQLRKDTDNILVKYYLRKAEQMESSNFIFGIDEFFLNTDVLKYIYINKIPFAISAITDIDHPLYNNFIRNDEYKNPAGHLVQFYKDIMQKYYNDNKSLRQNYDVIDKIVHNISFTLQGNQKPHDKSVSDLYETVYKNLIDVADKLYKNNDYKKYKFTEEEILCISRMDKNNPYREIFKVFDYNKKGGYYEKYTKYKRKIKRMIE